MKAVRGRSEAAISSALGVAEACGVSFHRFAVSQASRGSKFDIKDKSVFVINSQRAHASSAASKLLQGSVCGVIRGEQIFPAFTIWLNTFTARLQLSM